MALETSDETQTAPAGAGGMTRQRRWMVFGSNVAVMILLATALVVVVVWLSTDLLRGRMRGDWTAGGRFSLSPRTEALLDTLGERNLDVRLTNLYSHTPEIPASEAQWRRVQDMLSEYDMASGRVQVEAVNPAVDVGGVEQLIQRLTKRYAGQMRKPRRLVAEFQGLHEATQTLLQDEAKRLNAAADAWKDGPPEPRETLRMVAQVWGQLLMIGDFAAGNVRTLSEQPLPAYSEALDQAEDYLGQVRQRFEVVPEALSKIKDQAGDAEIPGPVRQILDGAEEAYAPLAKRIQAFEDEAADVEETELDQIRRDINQGETIVIETEAEKGVILTGPAPAADVKAAAEPAGAETVQPRIEGEGHEVLTPPGKLDAVRKAIETAGVTVESAEVARRPDAIEVVAFDDVWVRNPNAGQSPEAPERLFAGEMAVSSTLLGMVQKQKPAVLFVRSGGPATMPMRMPMGGGQPAPYRQMAERLEKANFLVQDWDPQRQPAMPEVEHASKIVLVLVPPGQPNPQMPSPPPDPESYAPAVEAIRQGAPAIVLGEPASLFQQSVPYADLFETFGVEAKFNAVAVHSVVVDAAGTEEALPQIQITDYADHEITRPVGALPSMLLTASPLAVKDEPGEGVSVTPLVELPGGRDYWADTVVLEAMQRQATFDAAEDIPGPVPLAVAATRQVGTGEQKVVLFGDADVAQDRVAFYRNPVMYRDRIEMQYQFPGNAEVFVNACLWVSGSEHLIAVSPEALQARRIGDLGGWQLPIQVLIIAGLPALVLGAGLLVYIIRRG
ncbi:MAG: hypothetical protein R6X20_09890 [Phycisphaerae bacterium]